MAAGTFLFPLSAVSAAESPSESNENITDELNLEDYLVTAERIPVSRWDTPANVTVITAQEIEENHYSDVAEALSHVNGVVVISFGAEVIGELRINGSDRVLVLIDGHRLNDTQSFTNYTKSYLNGIPTIKNIERIEVVKGGSSALYGSDAVGGVVNIITKKGKRNETTLDVNLGSWNQKNFELTNQGAIGKFSWFVTGGLAKRRAYEHSGNTSDIYSDTSDYKNDSATIRLDNQFDERSSLSFNFMHLYHQYNGYHNSELYNNVYASYNFKEGTSTPGWFRYFDNYKFNDIAGGYAVRARFRGFDYQNGWEFGKHKIIVGLEWMKTETTDLGYYGHEVQSVTNKAAYLQDTIQIGKWNIIPGIRVDHSDRFGTQSSPKLAVNYRADNKTKIYAAWGRVYNTPTTGQLYANANYNRDTLFFGNPNLRPEKGHTETIGIEHNFDENTSLALNLFNTKIKDGIAWAAYPYWYYNQVDARAHIDPDIAANINQAKYRGVELSFSQKVDEHFSYNLGYSHTKVDESYYANAYGQPNGYRIGLHYKNRAFKVNLLSIMGSSLNRRYYTSKNYAVFDFNVSYDITEQSTIYFKARNLTDEDYSNESKWYHSPGRSWQVGFTYKF